MRTASIGELVELAKGRKPDSIYTEGGAERRRLIQIGDLRSDDDVRFTNGTGGVAVKPSDICIAWDGANAGTVGFGLSGVIGSTIARLRPDLDQVATAYLGRFLQSQFQVLNGGSYGATIPHVNRDRLLNLRLAVPKVDEQKRIAAILDKADAIRAKRRATLAQADALLRATFLDIFCDPIVNPKGWNEERRDKIAEIRSGITKGRKVNGAPLRAVPYMRVANVQDGHIDLADTKTIEASETEIARYALRPGDILLTEGGDPDKLGRGAVWEGQIAECIHQNHIFAVRLHPGTKISPKFLSALLGSARGKRYFLRSAKQTTGIATINRTQLAAFPVLLPDKMAHDRWVRVNSATVQVGVRLAQLAEDADELYSSLAQRAFRGEL